MEFGVLPNWSWPVDGDPRRQMEQTIGQARAAVDSGYDAVWFGQHYISEGNNQFQPLPLLSSVATVADTIDLGTSVFLLPLHNPVAVAENFATADRLFDGKLRFGTALGYKPGEFEAFGIDLEDRVGRFVESLELIRRLWTEVNVSYSGRYFEVHDVTIDPRPAPDHEIWIGGNAEGSVRRAGRLGDGWIISARTSFDDARRLATIYQRAAANADRPAAIAMNREVFVAETTDEAVEKTLPMMKARAAAWLERGAHDTADQIENLDEQAYELLDDRIVGSPEQCIDKLARFREGCHLDHLIAMYNWRQLPDHEIIDSIQRFSQEVIPYFE